MVPWRIVISATEILRKMVRRSRNRFRRFRLDRGRIVEWYYKRIKQSAVILCDSRGFRFEFQPEDSFAHHINQGSFTDDPPVLAYLERCVKPGDTAFDVGARIGVVSVLAGRLVGSEGRVFAFEAEQINYTRLCRNVELNGLASVIPLHLVVYSSSGMIELRTFPRVASGWNTIGWFELDGLKPTGTESVPCVSLDDFCAERGISRIALLKIDIEGAEPEAFAGAEGLLTSHAIERIVFEISIPPLEGMGHQISDVVNPLVAVGYTIWDINGDGTLAGPMTHFADIVFDNLVALAPGIEG